MERYFLYLRNGKFKPSDAPDLLCEARTRISEKDDVVLRDLRIAKQFIELDISVSGYAVLEQAIGALSYIGELQSLEKIAEENLSKREALDKAQELFNSERYWKTHEVLENVWKRSDGREKQLLNGIILVAAALVHSQKAEDEICLGILNRAYHKLENGSGSFHGINIDSLKAEIKKILDSGTITRLTL